MPDVVDKATRSRMMSGIKGKNTKPEFVVRKLLTSAGLRYRLHRRDLPGAPDIVMPSRRIAVFVHGCFWHAHQGCRFFRFPDTSRDFWQAKLSGNAVRDADAVALLNLMGWRVLVVWECATRREHSQEILQSAMMRWIEGTGAYLELGETHDAH